MKPRKILVFSTALSIALLLLSLFATWMNGKPTGKRTTSQEGNNIRISVETESIYGWREIVTGLAPECVFSTIGPKWSLMPLVIPVAALLALFLVWLPWRKRPALKRDGFLLIGLGILILVLMWSWVPTCPPEVVSDWRYSGGFGQPLVILGSLLMAISGLLVIFVKPPKPAPLAEKAVVEYRTCLSCKEEIDRSLAECPHCGRKQSGN